MLQPTYALAESQRVRSAFLTQRTAVERAWGPVSWISDQDAPGQLIVGTEWGYVLLLGLTGAELRVDVIKSYGQPLTLRHRSRGPLFPF